MLNDSYLKTKIVFHNTVEVKFVLGMIIIIKL